MNVLVTGAAGFIGMHVAERLLARGDKVVGLDNLNDYYDVNLKLARLARLEGRSGFSFEKIDLADRDSVAAMFARSGIDRVVHLAAQAGVRYSLVNPAAYVDANVSGFLSILEGCRHHRVEHLVYASSSSVYGGNRRQPFSERDAVDHPVSLYAATKKANELMAHTYSHLFRVPTTGLRFFTVYGPWGRPDMALFLFTKAILEGRPIDVYNFGEMKRDFTYVDDIAESIVRLVDKAPPEGDERDDADPSTSDAPFRIFNIGNHDPVPLTEFIDCIEASVGRKSVRNMMPIQPGDVPATYADTARLSEWIGFAPATPVDDGIERFVRWYRDYYKV